jgi:type II secretory pathway pseudopilin PulG
MPNGEAMRGRIRREGGFTYLGLIILVTVIGLVGAATLKIDALLRRARAEQELLDIGAAFGEALRTYAEATPKGQPAQPPTLKELLKDPRFPGVRRHLRKIFVDPLTGKAEWGIVWTNPGDRKGVLAVYSLSQAKPLKQANFDARFSGFENKQHVSDWKFAATGQALMQGQVQMPGQTPGMPSLFAPTGAPPDRPPLFPGPGGAHPDTAPAAPPPPAPAPQAEPTPAAEPPQPPEPPSAVGTEGDKDEKDEKNDKDGDPAPPSPPAQNP